MSKSEHLLSHVRAIMAQWPRADLSLRETFLSNLLFMHRVILASEHLLEVGAEKTKGELRRYFIEHLDEERNHDEWLAADLAGAGVDVKTCPYSAEAVAMAGAQYYLIYHVDPVAFLGYMAVLECFPMPLTRVAELEAIHGASLCRTLRHHAEHDIDHGADLLRMIDALTDSQYRLVVDNAIQTALYIGSAICKFEEGETYAR